MTSEANPRYSTEELLAQITTGPEVAQKFSPTEVAQIVETVRSACKKNKTVELYYENYKNHPEELFTLEFGRPPKGRVVLLKTAFGNLFPGIQHGCYHLVLRYD